MKVEIKGVDDVMRRLGALGQKDAPFAMAKTLTRMAQRSQFFIRQHALLERFIIRRVSWMQQNIRITPATKQSLQAEVMDNFAAMVLQEMGGTKLAHGRYLCVPLGGARKSPRSIIRPDDYPSAVMREGGFIRGNVMYRPKYKMSRRSKGQEGPRNRSRVQNQIIPMYWLVHQAAVGKRYGFEADVRAIVSAQFEPEFTQIWNEIAKPTAEWPGRAS